jgi:hypothetical protein
MGRIYKRGGTYYADFVDKRRRRIQRSLRTDDRTVAKARLLRVRGPCRVRLARAHGLREVVERSLKALVACAAESVVASSRSRSRDQ